MVWLCIFCIFVDGMVENNGVVSSVATTAQSLLQNSDLMLLTKPATEIDGSLKIHLLVF